MNLSEEGWGEHTGPPTLIQKVVLDSFMPASRGNNSYLLQSLSSMCPESRADFPHTSSIP